jgi:hypothetical protein
MIESTDTAAETQDEPEGFEDDAYDLESYPLDNVLVRTEHYTIKEALKRIEEHAIELHPDYQRDFVWDTVRQSRLIESVLMRIPLPVLYVAEDHDGRRVVVDGLQRLTTFQRFANGQLRLELLNPELSGRDIHGLIPKLRRRFEDGQLVFYSIDSKVPDYVRFDIFDRVNSGVALTRQQMRNALYSGPATALLRELASSDDFNRATWRIFDRANKRQDQNDRYAINRFLAFHALGPDAYSGNMDEFLGRALKAVNRMSDEERQAIREAFLKSMRRNLQVFGQFAFTKHKSSQSFKSPFNLVIFEVFSVLFAGFGERRMSGSEGALQHSFDELMRNPRFKQAISGGTTTIANVRTRFELASAAVRGVLGDS